MLRVAGALLLGLALPAPDLIVPGERAIRHELLIAADRVSSARRLLLAPVQGFGSATLLRPGAASRFSTKYGSRLWPLAPDEPVPESIDATWTEGRVAIPIPFPERRSTPLASPVARVLTICRLVEQGGLRLVVVAERQFDAAGRPVDPDPLLPWLVLITLLGAAGLWSRARAMRDAGA
jgi:hypothetical protein